jgi:potassium-dependent mechanosensitive channel
VRVALVQSVRSRLSPSGALVVFSFATILGPLALQARSQTHPDAAPQQAEGSESSQQAPPTGTAAPAGRAIPLPQIADSADELDRWLRKITSQLTSEDLLGAKEEAENQSQVIRTNINYVNDLLMSNPTTLELQSEQRFWRILGQKYAGEREFLTPRAAELEQQIRHVDELNLDWQATWDQIHQNTEIQPVVDRTAEELELIREARVDLQKQLNLVLTLQNELSQMDRQIEDVLAMVQNVQARTRSRLFKRESLPIWKVREPRLLDQTLQTGIHQSFDRSVMTSTAFLHVHKLGVVSTLAFYLLTLIGALKVRRRLDRGRKANIPEAATRIFAFPFSIALLVALIVTIFYSASASSNIVFVICILYLIPVLRLLSPLLQVRLRTLLWALGVFYLLETLYLLIRFPPLIRREFHVLIVLAALICFGWLARPSCLRELSISPRNLRILKAGIGLGLALMTCSLAANILGFISLAQISGMTALLGAFAAAALYCAARILMLLFSAALRTTWAQAALESRGEAVERWAWRVLTLGFFYLWLSMLSRLLTIHEGVMRLASDVLAYPIGFQRVHITLGSVLSFLFILFAGYALTNVITFVLRTFLLSRFPLQRGLPFAVSKVTYYVLLVLFFLAALTNAGFELNKFTVVTGALGVGVGFGLQNIVNNFVSGLILLFERPIRVGDTIEISGLVGRVRRIGARSSTIHTFQDAEVIVPNSDLVVKEVINWTLTSLRRRVDISVGVAYGTDPERVITLLLELAVAHPAVIDNPKPEAYFLGFGESALNFELRFWTYQENWFQLKSDVAVRLVKVLREGNIEVPFPQRDLHIRNTTSVEENVPANQPFFAVATHSGGPDPAQAIPIQTVQQESKS